MSWATATVTAAATATSPNMATQASPIATRASQPLLLAAYYVWYHTGDHSRYPWSNWTRPEAAQNPLAQQVRVPGEPPLSSTARPLIGLYDSADPEVARWHIHLAQAVGIDAFLISWWDAVKERNQAFESGILAAAEQEHFKIALFQADS